MLYIVKRPFKSVGVIYSEGDIIEPSTNVRNIKSKCMGGKLLPVHDLNSTTVEHIRHLEAKFSMSLLPKVKAKLLEQHKGSKQSENLKAAHNKVHKDTPNSKVVIPSVNPVSKPNATTGLPKKAKVVVK